jgi:hypothetical protein
MKTILIMDIDGVLLRRRHPGMFDAFELAPGCLEFLERATARFKCRWLSARCRIGWPDGTRRAFRIAGAPLDDPRWRVLNLIESAAWRASKTEAIDPRSNFWWVDDDPSADDRDWLRLRQHEDRLIEVSSDRDPGALLDARARISLAAA